MAFIDQQEIFDKTNGGLDIILELFPDAHKAANKPNEKFKIREEKTPSASLKRLPDGTYVVTDWGGDQKPRNAIQLYMDRFNITFRQALEIFSERLQISGTANAVTLKADYEKRAPQHNEELGSFHYTTRDPRPDELAIWGPYVTQELLMRYHIFAVEEYRYIRADKNTAEPVAHVFRSTDQYPIFIIELGEWRKLYQPLNPDKSKRFLHDGERPKDFIFGLSQCQKAFDELNREREEGQKENKLPEILLCAGERDAMNAASMGYQVIWMNSETAELTWKEFRKLSSLADRVCNVPDLDPTGQRRAHELATQFLDLHTVRLPRELTTHKDWRGNPCKDLRDYMKYYSKNHFRELISVALPYRMWDEAFKDGARRFFFNNAHTYNFLQQNGFYRIDFPNSKNGYTFIRFQDNVVEETSPVKIKNYINTFLKDRRLPPALWNTFYRAQNQLAETSLSNLDVVDVDFTDSDRHRQFLFFKNTTWEVTAQGVKEHPKGYSEKYVWREEVIDQEATLAEKPPFEVVFDKKKDSYSITIHNRSCLFLRYLINSSRIYWREEMEQGRELTPEQVAEQDLHLINKLYSLGYLLHRYKDPSRPWCVFAMDNKISETGESHGGTGKSIAYTSLRYFMKSTVLEGRNPKLTDNPHMYENVTPHTDYVLVDDANQYLKFDYFFSALTGSIIVNPKHGKQFEIPFPEVPKFAITSNFTLRNVDPSTERRLLYTVFSDYYHYNKDNEYNESRSPYDDFGKNLFIDFTEEEWNLCFNTIAQCLVTYLNFPKIDPPMENVEKRNLRTVMTEVFKEWADIYFDQDSNRTDDIHSKHDAFENFKTAMRINNWTPNRFTKSLKAWCKYYGFVLNPDVLTNTKGRIVRKLDGQSHEYIYIKAYESGIKPDALPKHGEVLDDLPHDDDDDNLPF
jgi:hypothetical protein